MATYTYTVSNKIEVVSPAGQTVETPVGSFSANGQVLYDDILPISTDFDLEPFFATLDEPSHIAIKFYDPAGFKIAWDGLVANASPVPFTEMYCKFGSPSGGPPIPHLVTTVAARLQIIALGDPLP